MTPEELLKPRYKVIAGFPCSIWEQGEIIYMKQRPDGAWWTGDSEFYLTESDLKLYPHIFKHMSWWEERQENEMPEYVKVADSGMAERTGLFHKVTEWSNINNNGELFDDKLFAELEGYRPIYSPNKDAKLSIDWLLPATLEEYNNYKDKQQ